jgi:hypothetical protein
VTAKDCESSHELASSTPAQVKYAINEERDMLKGLLQSLFSSPSVRAPFNDPILGPLQPGETGWSANIVKGADHFVLTIGGNDKPDDALLAHAHDILGDYPSFKNAVKFCVEYESRDYPPEVKAELAGLEINIVALWWPTRPNDGMIFFRGSEKDIGAWRCDYINRKPMGLGCDT